MEGSVIRGPFALCEGAVVKMAAKVYRATTVGPFQNWEVNNSVISAYSTNMMVLGNSGLEWCNIGADSNNSNQKTTMRK
jgi:hypothetical protein